MQRLAERGVFHFDHIPVQSRLLVEIDVAEGRGNLRRNIVLPEMLDPLMSGPRGDDGPVGSEIRRHVARRPLRIEPGDFRLAQFCHGIGHQWGFIRRVMHMNPAAVGALVQRDRNVLVQPLGEYRRRCLRAAPVHGHRDQRGLSQTGVRGAATAITITRDQPRHHAHHTQPACQPIGKGHAHEDRPRAVARLFVEQAQACQHQRFTWHCPSQWMLLRPAGNGRNDQRRKALCQLCIVEPQRRGLLGSEFVNKHVGRGQQPFEPLLPIRHVDIQRDTALAPIEHGEQRFLAPSRVVGRFDQKHLGTRFVQLQARRSTRDTRPQTDHTQAVQR